MHLWGGGEGVVSRFDSACVAKSLLHSSSSSSSSCFVPVGPLPRRHTQEGAHTTPKSPSAWRHMHPSCIAYAHEGLGNSKRLPGAGHKGHTSLPHPHICIRKVVGMGRKSSLPTSLPPPRPRPRHIVPPAPFLLLRPLAVLWWASSSTSSLSLLVGWWVAAKDAGAPRAHERTRVWTHLRARSFPPPLSLLCCAVESSLPHPSHALDPTPQPHTGTPKGRELRGSPPLRFPFVVVVVVVCLPASGRKEA